MRPPGTPAQLEKRRRRAIDMLQQGMSTSQIARRVNVDARSVRRWREMYERDGPAGLAARPAPGRPSKLGTRQRNALRRRLLKGAKANGFPTDLWTCARVAELIERRYGVTYHPDHVGRLLASRGFSCQKPSRRAMERDEQRVEQGVARDWPRIKKSRPAARSSRVRR